MGIFKATDGTSDPIITRMVQDDKVPWYKKKNLRYMYVFLFACCMGVEITSGFDSQLINTLQFSPAFNKCKYLFYQIVGAMIDNYSLWRWLLQCREGEG